MSRNGFDRGDYRSEEHFFEIFSGDYPKPPWLLGIERSSPRQDIQGVDAVAKVKYPDGSMVLVPIQVKPDESEIGEYYRRHPLAYKAKVVIIVVYRRADPGRVRGLLYREFERCRCANIRYTEFLTKLEEEKLSPKTYQLVRRIQRQREGIGGPLHA